MRGGKEEEGNSMVIYAMCTGGCAEEADVCVQVCVQMCVQMWERWERGCVDVCIHRCLTSENMSPC